MKQILRAEMWDKMQYLFRNYYDRMMHCALYYGGRIDEGLFRKALKFQIDAVPVLHSRYHNNFIKPFWVVQDYTMDEVLTVKESRDIESDVNAFITQRIPIKKNVQTQVALFYHGDKTVFCMVNNHMCMDGGDFKYFVTTLCKNYSKLLSGDENLEIKSGSRAYSEIYSSLSDEDRRAAKKLYKNISALPDKHRFPLTPPSENDVNRVLKHVIPAEKFEAMRKAAKSRGYTVNDAMLALYVRSLYEIGNFDKDDVVTIPNMVDLRRHLSNGGMETGLTNHTGFMPCTVRGIGEDISDTLQSVAEGMKANKNDKFLGLYSLPLLNLAYTIFPHFISEFAIKLGYDNPLMGMSNIGVIKPEEYRMGELSPEDGFYTGAIKGKPFMQLAFTTMNGAVTMSIAICGNEKDDEIVERFYEIFDRNLDGLAALAKA